MFGIGEKSISGGKVDEASSFETDGRAAGARHVVVREVEVRPTVLVRAPEWGTERMLVVGDSGARFCSELGQQLGVIHVSVRAEGDVPAAEIANELLNVICVEGAALWVVVDTDSAAAPEDALERCG